MLRPIDIRSICNYILDNKYKISLNFDGYDEIMKTFTEYSIAQDKIRKLKIQLQLLQK